MQLPQQLGLWRLGQPVHQNDTFQVALAQPVDAKGSRRWDYVVKLGHRRDGQLGIHQTIAAGSSILHPNVVSILDGDPLGTFPYVIMPRLEGATLAERMTQNGTALPVLLWIVRQLCQALEAVHGSGWSHRDIKPANVFVGENGHVTLLDLAFASPQAIQDDATFKGTPKYAAPELFTSAPTRGPAADIFAVGRVLWEGLARVETQNEEALSAACELVERMVAEEPSDRPTAHELTQTLLRLEIDTLSEHVGPQTGRRAA
ncbi:MAG: protein kinase family protein [Planctomycetota bacterium]